MLLAARRQNGIGEDSSRQDMEKKNMRWERIEDAEGMRSRADLNRDRWSQSRVLTVTPRDQLMEVTGRVT